MFPRILSGAAAAALTASLALASLAGTGTSSAPGAPEAEKPARVHTSSPRSELRSVAKPAPRSVARPAKSRPAPARVHNGPIVTGRAWAAGSGYTRAQRPNSKITRVVVHMAEGTASGTVQWFRNSRAQSSAHYVVSAGGQVTQTVPNRSIAWHSGNTAYNETSIGIEHAGYTRRKSSFTEPMYRASARLVAALGKAYSIPLDRAHVVGHNEVPDPHNPRLRGGFDHHTDPGPHWDWKRYMRYVHAYAKHGPDALAVRPTAQGKGKRS